MRTLNFVLSLSFAAALFGVSAIWTAIPKSIETFNIFRIIGGECLVSVEFF